MLRAATGDPEADFRPGQWEAIAALVDDRARLLVVQRTGWGKSVVYFIATALLRGSGAGPTVIISPLLALMRNQLAAASGLGLRGASVDSNNMDAWPGIYDAYERDEIDVLIISPERLANSAFMERAGNGLLARLGLFVIDEAHCISDWGHDFRPHYRRLSGFVRNLPANVPMLATTATADATVESDVVDQLQGDIIVQRGTLERESLRLDVIRGRSQAQRLAWLAGVLPSLPGSGIVYTLTQDDANIVAAWLDSQRIAAAPYHAGVAPGDRERRETDLLTNRVKALVATSALGMGYDKPDLAFVVHFQSPQSITHYYQQVGRAGRKLADAIGVLFVGNEDQDIHDFFVRNALPGTELVADIVAAVAAADDGLSTTMLAGAVNVEPARIKKAVQFLELEEPSPLVKVGTRYRRTAVPYVYPHERARMLAARRGIERDAFLAYASGERCLMQTITVALGDAEAPACGRCAVCIGADLVDPGDIEDLTAKAEDFLTRREIMLPQRKKWPEGGLAAYGFPSNTLIAPALLAEPGRALALWKRGVIGRRLRNEKYIAHAFSDITVEEAAMCIRAWAPDPAPRWVVGMNSQRRPDLVPDFGRRLAEALGLRYVDALRTTRDTDEQKNMHNASFRVRNLDGSIEVIAFDGMETPGLLVDDMYDAGWTIAVAAALLRRAGSGRVFPFTLAKAADRE